IDHGSNPSSQTIDGRGQPRTAGNAPDMGAVESTFTIPVAQGTVADITTAGATSYTFTVNYLDSTGIDVSTLDSNDVRVSGPSAFSQLATFVSVTPTGNGTPRTATYSFTPPGGSWDAADNGTYTATVLATQVMTVGGTPVPQTPVGSFRTLISLSLVVTNANDAGAGSLRQAILDTNAANTVHTIGFDPTFF